MIWNEYLYFFAILDFYFTVHPIIIISLIYFIIDIRINSIISDYNIYKTIYTEICFTNF